MIFKENIEKKIMASAAYPMVTRANISRFADRQQHLSPTTPRKAYAKRIPSEFDVSVAHKTAFIFYELYDPCVKKTPK